MAAAGACVALLALAGCGDDARPAAAAGSSTAPASTVPASTVPASTAPPSTSTTNPEDASALTAAVQQVVDGFTSKQPVPFHVVVVDLPTGIRVTHDADDPVLSASLYKLFVARELIRRIDAGELNPNADAGDTKHRTVEQCIDQMIVVSDNDCGAAGLHMVGSGALDARLHRDGFVGTSLASPQRTSAADVSLFLQRAHDGTLLGSDTAGSAKLYSLLQQQQVNDRLPHGLPPGTPIAHKTGDRLHWAHDAGVVTTPRGDVVIAVLSGPWNAPCCDADHPGPAEATAFGAIAELGREVYAAVS